ncbi:MAG: outer membrane protein assembly factor BamD [bacterium]
MALAVLICLSLIGCTAKKSVVRLDAEDQFNLGKREFDRERYLHAAEAFRRLIFEHPGSARVDEAQFLLAKCYYNMKDYLQAEAEFKHLALNYPDSPYADDAAYYVGMTHYKQMPAYYHDQSETQKAIDSFSRFLVKYPDSALAPQAEKKILDCRDRLARKEFENGKLYLKLKGCGPAIVYFEYVTSEYPDTRWCEEAKKLLNECQEKLSSAESDSSHTKK